VTHAGSLWFVSLAAKFLTLNFGIMGFRSVDVKNFLPGLCNKFQVIYVPALEKCLLLGRATFTVCFCAFYI
jgi:hypothetical protein